MTGPLKMQLTIEIPEIVCCRCGKTTSVIPAQLKRSNGENTIADSMGNTWLPNGAIYPAGWTRAPNDNSKNVCEECTPVIATKIGELFAPPKPETSQQAPGPGITRTAGVAKQSGVTSRPINAPQALRTQSVPIRTNSVIHSTHPSVTHPAAPMSRPVQTAVATLPKVLPSTIARPATPVATPASTVIATSAIVGTQRVRSSALPAQAIKPEPEQIAYPSTQPTMPVTSPPIHVERPEVSVSRNVGEE